VLNELCLDSSANVHRLSFRFNRQLNAVVDCVLCDDELLGWILEPHIGMVMLQLNAMTERLLKLSVSQAVIAPGFPEFTVAKLIGIALQVIGFGFSIPEESDCCRLIEQLVMTSDDMRFAAVAEAVAVMESDRVQLPLRRPRISGGTGRSAVRFHELGRFRELAEAVGELSLCGFSRNTRVMIHPDRHSSVFGLID
jgi:hypothetical protein